MTKLKQIIEPAPLLTRHKRDRTRHEAISTNSQIIRNYIVALEILDSLLDQDNPRLSSLQVALYRAGVLEPLVSVALTELPIAMRRAAFHTLGHLCKRQSVVQTAISRHIHEMPSSDLPHIPLVLAAIKIAVGGGVTSGKSLAGESLRAAAVQMLGSYLETNADGQLVIAATFKSPRLEGSPETNSPLAISAGSIIVERIIEVPSATKQGEVRQSVFASLLLAHIVRGNSQVKQLAMAHQVAEDEGLLVRILQNLPLLAKESGGSSAFIQMIISQLILLCTWIDGFLPASHLFLSEGSNVHLVNRATSPSFWCGLTFNPFAIMSS